MVLYIDDRENDILIHKLFARLGDRDYDKGGLAQVKRLKSGDYIIGKVGIEAKEINDLYNSVLGRGRSRTIADQLYDLKETFDRPILVVYNTKMKPYVPGGRPNARQFAIETERMRRTVKAFKMNFHLKYTGIDFMHLETMNDFVDYLVTMHTHTQIIGVDEWVRKEKKIQATDPSVLALSALPGITEKMAEDLLKRHGSMKDILRLRTSQRSLMETKGIGRGKARCILSMRDKYEPQS